MTHSRRFGSPQPARVRRRGRFRPQCEALEERQVPATFLVTNTFDSGPGSLRHAIVTANNTPNLAGSGIDQIHFAIGSGPKTIHVGSSGLGALPVITDAVVIDGATQPGFAGKPLIELSGLLAGAQASGLQIDEGGCTVKGLIVNRFAVFGIILNVWADGNTVQGNYIGTDATGTQDLGNHSNGLTVYSANNQIGGAAPGQGNLISGNDRAGLSLTSGADGNKVQGNLIGTDISGTQNLGNGEDGIYITATSGNLIGGTALGAGNTIAFNTLNGVTIDDDFSPEAHAILGNAIFANGGLGIDLGQDGVTLNDLNDADSGANDLQNFPVLSSAVVTGGQTVIDGTLRSTSNSTFRLEFFNSPAGDPSGLGEGQTFLGTLTVSAGLLQNQVAFTFSVPFAVPAGHVITATATRIEGDTPTNTSEFSPWQAMVNLDPPPPAAPDSPVVKVTTQVAVIRGKVRRTRVAGRYRQKVTLVNTGNSAVQGPLYLVLDGLRRRVKLRKPDGLTQKAAPIGSRYRLVNVPNDQMLDPGESLTVTLQFNNPLLKRIRYTPRVLAGVDAP